MTDDSTGQIDHVMHEKRLFQPSNEFSSKAVIGSLEQYEELYNQAKDDPQGFWGELGKNELHWFEPFQEVISGSGPDVQWFSGGKTNIAYNCLDASMF